MVLLDFATPYPGYSFNLKVGWKIIGSNLTFHSI